MHTGSELLYVAVMAIVGPFADLHVASVDEAGRLSVSEREATLIVIRRISTIP